MTKAGETTNPHRNIMDDVYDCITKAKGWVLVSALAVHLKADEGDVRKAISDWALLGCFEAQANSARMKPGMLREGC